MAIAPKYSFIIKGPGGARHEFEQATNRAWEVYENDVGRCRFFVPYNDTKLSTTSIPDDAYSEILIYRNGTLVWQGIVQIVQDVIDGAWVYGETFVSALGWYGVRYNEDYISTGVGSIITAEYDNIETRTNNFLSAKITQGTIQEPYITETTNTLTINRTLFNENFLLFLKQMVLVARAESTAAWEQNAAFNISFSETTPTFTFSRDVGSDQENVVFELDSEIVDFNIPRDNRSISNWVKGFAIGEGPVVLSAEYTEPDSQNSWYLREFYPFFANVTAQDDLNSRSENFSLDRKDPRRDMKIKLAAGLTPFDGYALGDSIRVRLNRGRVNIDELRRVVGMEVSIDDTGIENIAPVLQKKRS